VSGNLKSHVDRSVLGITIAGRYAKAMYVEDLTVTIYQRKERRPVVDIVQMPDHTYVECDRYKVTGKIYNTNRNFPAIHTRNFHHAKCINLWRGTVWGHDVITGKWRKLWEVYN